MDDAVAGAPPPPLRSGQGVLLKDALEVRHPTVVTHRDQNAAGPRVNSAATQDDVRPHVEIELLESLLGFAARFRVDTSGNGERCEEKQRETDSTDRCNLFR